MPGALPNLVVIGAAKCGTTSLHHYLDAHPDIAMSRLKEPNFFLLDGNWARGTAWYRSQFRAAMIRGESSTGYTDLPSSVGVAERMRDVLGEPHLIYLVRDPLERIVSHYVHRTAARVESRPLTEALRQADNPYVRASRYATQLAPFLAAFPRERILIESQERLLSARPEVLARIFQFLGVRELRDLPEFDRLWEQSGGKGRLYRLAWSGAERMRRRNLRLPSPLRWPAQRVLRARVFSQSRAQPPQVDPELIQALRKDLKPEADGIRALSGLALETWSV